MAETAPSTVAVLPTPGMGHLIPLVEFAKRLVLNHGIHVTFLIPTDGPPSQAVESTLSNLPSGINHIFLPPVSFDDLPEGTRAETLISLTVVRSLPSLRHVFRSLVGTTQLAALVVDLFGTDAFDVAAEFGVSPYIFYPSSALALSLFFHLPKLDESVSCEYREMPEPVRIPGCVPVPGGELLDPVQDRKNDAYKWLLHHTRRYHLAEGILANSFMELEGGALKSLQEPEPRKPPVYPVGPLVQMEVETRGGDGSDCLNWLDEQPDGSVLFVSFGSGGSLSSKQLKELALGLEESGQRFLLVVRSPSEKKANASYFTAGRPESPFDFLPEGFVERTGSRGLVVPSWAPQAQILSHGSTGGFLSHCGWNSALESVVNGVPMIAWPLYAEQKMNAVMLAEDVKVALRPERGEDGLVGREEIAKVAKDLMEGEGGKRIRNRMRDLKEAAARVLGEEGASTKALAEVALKWKAEKLVHSQSIVGREEGDRFPFG